MNKIVKLLIVSVLSIGVVGSEAILRNKYGFANAPLYYASEKYEYMAIPNQQGNRFGYKFYYNAFSHRSNEVNKNKPKILGLGDSVIFGGTQTDQDSIATSIVTQETKYQMLNISAGSWGPDNCAAYLNEHGLFDAEAMVLVVSSHDAHDNMDFKPVVGIHKSYPNKQYKLAWFEVLDRYVLPRIFKSKKKTVDPDSAILQGIQKSGKEFNPGFEQLRVIAKGNNIPLIIYLHAELVELTNKKYNSQGDEIIGWAKANGIMLIKGLDYNLTKRDYRDGIHLNQHGQRELANIMMKDIIPKI